MTEVDSQLLGEHKPPVLAQPSHSGALAQLGERRLCKPEVAGSNPARSTRKLAGNGPVFSWAIFANRLG